MFVPSPLAFLQSHNWPCCFAVPDESVYGDQVSSIECPFKGNPLPNIITYLISTVRTRLVPYKATDIFKWGISWEKAAIIDLRSVHVFWLFLVSSGVLYYKTHCIYAQSLKLLTYIETKMVVKRNILKREISCHKNRHVHYRAVYIRYIPYNKPTILLGFICCV